MFSFVLSFEEISFISFFLLEKALIYLPSSQKYLHPISIFLYFIYLFISRFEILNKSISSSGIVKSLGPKSYLKSPNLKSDNFPPNELFFSNTNTSYPLHFNLTDKASPAIPDPIIITLLDIKCFYMKDITSYKKFFRVPFSFPGF